MHRKLPVQSREEYKLEHSFEVMLSIPLTITPLIIVGQTHSLLLTCFALGHHAYYVQCLSACKATLYTHSIGSQNDKAWNHGHHIAST
jgi:hypothetical protein